MKKIKKLNIMQLKPKNVLKIGFLISFSNFNNKTLI